MVIDSPIIEFDSIDSTNNYAMQLIDANKAQHGLTVTAQSQSSGKGQRGKVWEDIPGQSLLMSVIILPQVEIRAQFAFNAAVASAIANVLQKLRAEWQVRVKWPNDIIINDKKAGGILIENVLRGSKWTHSVVGLGLNLKQASFPETLPFATSLHIEAGEEFNMTGLRDDIRAGIVLCGTCPPPVEKMMEQYNQWLYRRGQKQVFSDGNSTWTATLLGVHNDGTLEVQLADGTIVFYHHGQVEWVWGTPNA